MAEQSNKNISGQSIKDGQTRAAVLMILERRGMTAHDVAKAAVFYDICAVPETVTRWLDGNNIISIEKAERIVTMLRCSLDVFDDMP